MKYIPILYSTPMVQALLDKRKTITRRTNGLDKFNENPDSWRYDGSLEQFPNGEIVQYENHFMERVDYLKHPTENYKAVKCPYGKVGDVLWVRETFGKWKDDYYYKASTEVGDEVCIWKPSIHMPKVACRMWLEITNIRVERLQDIGRLDALSEGIYEGVEMEDTIHEMTYYQIEFGGERLPSAVQAFAELWRKINGADSWNANPWVWVIEFKQIEKPDNFK